MKKLQKMMFICFTIFLVCLGSACSGEHHDHKQMTEQLKSQTNSK
jgi:hypothetical protein